MQLAASFLSLQMNPSLFDQLFLFDDVTEKIETVVVYTEACLCERINFASLRGAMDLRECLILEHRASALYDISW